MGPYIFILSASVLRFSLTMMKISGGRSQESYPVAHFRRRRLTMQGRTRLSHEMKDNKRQYLTVTSKTQGLLVREILRPSIGSFCLIAINILRQNQNLQTFVYKTPPSHQSVGGSIPQ